MPDTSTAVTAEPLTAQVVPKAILRFDEVSKWYGNVIGVNKLTLRIAGGVTGLLGPNGAGKSTLLQLATGQLYPSQGEVRLWGHRVWNNPGLNAFIGLCPGAGRLLRMDDRLGLRLHLRPPDRHEPKRGQGRHRTGPWPWSP